MSSQTGRHFPGWTDIKIGHRSCRTLKHIHKCSLMKWRKDWGDKGGYYSSCQMRKQVKKRPHLDGKVKLAAFAYHETVKVGDISKEISTKRKYFLTPPSRSQNNLASPHIFPGPLPPHPREDQFSPVILDVETERELLKSTNTFKGEVLLPTRPSSLSLFLYFCFQDGCHDQFTSELSLKNACSAG